MVFPAYVSVVLNFAGAKERKMRFEPLPAERECSPVAWLPH